MFECDSADMCANKISLVSMGGWAEGQACADPGARTPIGASGISYLSFFLGHILFSQLVLFYGREILHGLLLNIRIPLNNKKFRDPHFPPYYDLFDWTKGRNIKSSRVLKFFFALKAYFHSKKSHIIQNSLQRLKIILKQYKNNEKQAGAELCQAHAQVD